MYGRNTVYIFHVNYAGVSDWEKEEIEVEGAESTKEAFIKALDKLSRGDIRSISLFDMAPPKKDDKA